MLKPFKIFSFILIFNFALLFSFARAEATEYQINVAHSNISFNIMHFGKGKVKGQFRLFSGSLEYDGHDFKNAKTQAQIDTSSIYTGISARDEHLRSPKFLDVKKYPAIEFISTAIKEKNEKEFIVSGKLTIHGITQPVELQTKLIEISADQKTVLFKANTILKRKNFGLFWNDLVESGHIVGEDIKVSLEIEGNAK